MAAVAAAAAATSPVSASAAKEVEVEAEAEAATKELGAAAPHNRARNQSSTGEIWSATRGAAPEASAIRPSGRPSGW